MAAEIVVTSDAAAPLGAAYRRETIAVAVSLWADATTDRTSPRRRDLLRDKQTAVLAFFDHCRRPPQLVTAAEVKAWQLALEAEGLAAATVYSRLSRVSSFYEWAQKQPQLQEALPINPVRLARPKSIKPYQGELTKALADEELTALLKVVKARADKGELIGLRDYALLRLYVATGMRRREIVQLRRRDVVLDAGRRLQITTRVKGGEVRTREVADTGVRRAVLAYLQAEGRLERMDGDAPLWLRHDRAAEGEQALTSHGLVKSLKAYAAEAGLDHFHLHQTRHTYARLVGEEASGLGEVQDALGHENRATTKIYLRRVSVQKDKFSRVIADRLGLADE
jgi:integrase